MKKLILVLLALILSPTSLFAQEGAVIDSKLSELKFLHVPSAEKYSDVYLGVFNHRIRKGAHYKIALIDRSTLEVVKEIELLAGGRQVLINRIDSDASGVIYAEAGRGDVYRTFNEGASWQQLDFDGRSQTYVFGSADTISSKPNRRGGWFQGTFKVADNGDVLMYSSYGGPRLTLIPSRSNSATLGAELDGTVERDGYWITSESRIIFEDRQSRTVLQSSDGAKSYAKLALTANHELVGVSDSGQIFTWSGNSNFVDGMVVKDNRGRSAYGNLRILGDGTMHSSLTAPNGRQMMVGSARNKSVKSVGGRDTFSQVESDDGLFLFKKSG